MSSIVDNYSYDLVFKKGDEIKAVYIVKNGNFLVYYS